jgi:hypothetical protein
MLYNKKNFNQKIHFLPYKPGAAQPVASAPLKALMCFCLSPPGAEKLKLPAPEGRGLQASAPVKPSRGGNGMVVGTPMQLCPAKWK